MNKLSLIARLRLVILAVVLVLYGAVCAIRNICEWVANGE